MAGGIYPVLENRSTDIETHPGYEGNGYAIGLWKAIEPLIPAWVHQLCDPRRVLAYHKDGAHGAEEPIDQLSGYRTLWTSNLLSELGYTNVLGALNYYLGEAEVKELGQPERHWIKILRH